MARILIVWELGKGFGHLTPYLKLVRELRQRKHQVVFAARDVGSTEKIFGSLGITVLQAPIMMHNVSNPYPKQYSFVHLMHNIGFADIQSVFGLVKAWRLTYRYVQPDLALFDHSPTALVAAQGFPWKRIISGSGFLVPPNAQPWPKMRYWQQYDQKQLAEEEGRLLESVNRMLEALKVNRLQAMAELYDADDQFLLSFKELDHYPMREGGKYVGMFSTPDHGVPPVWPGGLARKVFAYLHPHKRTEDLLATLAQGKFSSIVYAPEVPLALKQKYQSGRLAFSTQPLNVAQTAAQCQVAVTNGTFGTTAAFLLHGKPVLAVPTNLERFMVARRVVEMGGGVAVDPNKPETFKEGFRALFTSDRYLQAAQVFAQRYQDRDIHWQTQTMVESIERLLPAQSPPAAPAAVKQSKTRPARKSRSRRSRKKSRK